jgi:hypothetical protein
VPSLPAVPARADGRRVVSATDPLLEVPVRDLDDRGHVIYVRRSWRSNVGKVRTLRDIAAAGVDREDDFAAVHVARTVASDLDGVDALEAIHAFVRDHVAYEDETIERLESAAFVLWCGEADCDGQAVTQATLVASIGHSAALVPLGGPSANDPQHLGIAVRVGGGEILAWPWRPFERSPSSPPGGSGLRRRSRHTSESLRRMQPIAWVRGVPTSLPSDTAWHTWHTRAVGIPSRRRGLGLGFSPILAASLTASFEASAEEDAAAKMIAQVDAYWAHYRAAAPGPNALRTALTAAPVVHRRAGREPQSAQAQGVVGLSLLLRRHRCQVGARHHAFAHSCIRATIATIRNGSTKPLRRSGRRRSARGSRPSSSTSIRRTTLTNSRTMRCGSRRRFAACPLSKRPRFAISGRPRSLSRTRRPFRTCSPMGLDGAFVADPANGLGQVHAIRSDYRRAQNDALQPTIPFAVFASRVFGRRLLRGRPTRARRRHHAPRPQRGVRAVPRQ